MNAPLQIALLALVPVCMLFAGSIVLFFSAKTVASFLQLLGAACLVIVVLTHLSGAQRIPMGEQSLLLTLDSCTILVKNGDVRSKRSKTRKSPPTKAMVRLTVSLPKAVLSRVNIIAGQMEVSAGWVIRKAVIEFVNRDIPLFRSDEKF
jgi:hypothetical protein